MIPDGYLWMVVAGFIATLVASFRSLPANVAVWIRDRVLLTVTVSNDDALFRWVSIWLAEQRYSQRARSLVAVTDISGQSRQHESIKRDSVKPSILFTPAPGHHVFRYNNRWVWLQRDRKDAETPDKNSNEISLLRKHESFTIRVIGKSQTAIRNLLTEARDFAFARREAERKVELFMPTYGAWGTSLGERDPRSLGSIFLPGNIKANVLADVSRFLDSRDWYRERGVPWRRGYLLHGLAGTGKTSLITAIAGHFKFNLYILNVLNAKVSDGEVMSLVASIPPRSILLLEDVDAAFSSRDVPVAKANGDVPAPSPEARLSFSGLLNALDGVGSSEGILTFMTTNHRERLDPALIRKGRADVHVEFGHAPREQADEMYSAFFPSAERNGFGSSAEAERLVMCEVQERLLSMRSTSAPDGNGK